LATLTEIYERLFATLGPQQWWPGESPFEVLVGAILVQNTSWRNVERAIENLREAAVLSPRAIHELAQEELEELVRPAGYYRIKARRLKNLIEFIVDRYDGSLDAMFATELSELRGELLTINGVGPETADSILLYAGDLPIFVVDTYTLRIFARHGWIDYAATYHELQEHFQSGLPDDPQLYNEYHALLVRIGNQYCRKKPKCDECPLQDMLPESGIVEPEF